jgi:hypothetical protein
MPPCKDEQRSQGGLCNWAASQTHPNGEARKGQKALMRQGLTEDLDRSLGGRRRRSEMGENRGSPGSADEPRVGPWALEAMPGQTGFSAIAAGALSAAQAPRHDG